MVLRLIVKWVIFLIGATIIAIVVFTVLKQQKKIQVNNSSALKKEYVPIPPTINSIFSVDNTFVATLSAKNITILIATGDVIPARSVNFQTTKRNNFIWPFEKTMEFLKNADITFINLETPLIDNCPITVEGMIFCANEKNIEGLVASGVDVVSMANNHAGNYGEEGVIKTSQLLRSKGIEVTGIEGAVYKEVNGVVFAFLGFNDITKPQPGVVNAEKKLIKKQIEEARKKAEVVIVAFHWGVEYKDLPDSRQIELGHFAIDSGADLIIGNHPHWIQPIEFYKGRLIAYAHGNFVFDQMWSEKTKEGVVGKYTFYNNKLIDVEYLPVKIEDFGQPYFLEGDDKARILNAMKQNSIKLQLK